MDIKKKIEETRSEKEMTLEQLAEKSGYSRQNLYIRTRGDNRPPYLFCIRVMQAMGKKAVIEQFPDGDVQWDGNNLTESKTVKFDDVQEILNNIGCRIVFTDK